MPEAMVEQAAKPGNVSSRHLDRDGLYGAPRLYMTAKKLGLRSHVGAEISVIGVGSGASRELATAHDSRTTSKDLRLSVSRRPATRTSRSSSPVTSSAKDQG
jgi:hypothetical protein